VGRDPGERRVLEIALARRPRVEPERASAAGGAELEQCLRCNDVSPQQLPAGDALELPQLLEWINSDVRVRADRERKATLGHRFERREAVAEGGLRGGAQADSGFGLRGQGELVLPGVRRVDGLRVWGEGA